MEERLDVVIDPTSGKRGIDVLVQAMSKLHSTTGLAQGGITSLINAMSTGLRGFESAVLSLRSVLIGFGSVITIFRQLGNEFTRFQAFTSALSVAVGGAKEARQEYQFLINMADRLGIAVTSLQRNYGQLAAATKSAGFSMESLHKVFESFSVAARVLHLSGQDTSLMFYALTQMVSKGTVSMEELRRQLGEKVPGAMNIAANSVGATVEQFEAAVRKGSVSAAKFLPIFSEAVREAFIAGLPNAMKAFDAEVNRLMNTFQKIIVTMMDMGVAESFTEIIKELNRVLSDPEIIKAFAETVRDIADGVSKFLKGISSESIRTFVQNFAGGVKSIAKAITEDLMPLLVKMAGLVEGIVKGWATIKGAELGGRLGALAGGKGAAIGTIVGGAAGYLGTNLLFDNMRESAASLGNRQSVTGRMPARPGIATSDPLEEGLAAYTLFGQKPKAKLGDVLFDKEKNEKDKELESQLKAYEAAVLSFQKTEADGNKYVLAFLDIQAGKYSKLTDTHRQALLMMAAYAEQVKSANAYEKTMESDDAMAVTPGMGTMLKDQDSARIRLADRVKSLEEEMIVEEELQQMKYERELALLDEALARKAITQQKWAEIFTLIEERHLNKLEDLRKKKLTDAEKFQQKSYREQAATIFGELEAITAGVAQHNKALFQINKVAAIANAIISAHQGAARSLATYPWPLAGIMAAIHYAAGLARVRAIASTSFEGGGGGSAPSVAGSAPATPVTPITSPTDPQSRNVQTTTVHLYGRVYDRQQVRDLLEELAEDMRDGGRLVVRES